jgi:acyl-CoA thioesterase-2
MPLLAGFDVRAARPAGHVDRRVMHPYWIRATGAVPHDRDVHEAIVGLLTDIGVSASASPPGTPFRESRNAVSLDHALWWHRPPRVDQWLRLDAEPIVNHGGRGLARGTVCDVDGVVIASFSQEVLLAARG